MVLEIRLFVHCTSRAVHLSRTSCAHLRGAPLACFACGAPFAQNPGLRSACFTSLAGRWDCTSRAVQRLRTSSAHLRGHRLRTPPVVHRLQDLVTRDCAPHVLQRSQGAATALRVRNIACVLRVAHLRAPD